jgi:osmoprotectant transport system ATP-binding protein
VSDQSLTSGSATSGVAIELHGVTKQYPGVDHPAVESVDLLIPAGETVVLVGPSGCGKTTTMKMINRIIEPTAGQITVDGRDVLTLDPAQLRRGIGYVIQQIGLFPHMTVEQNIGLVPGMLGWSRTRTAERVMELLQLVGLEPGLFARRYPRQLSGGQQQRIGVARALAADPPVMLMDEPFGATDPITRRRLQDEFRALQERLRKTIVFVTHDFEEALTLGDRIAVLAERSRIVQYDTPSAILAAPVDDYVASFVGMSASVKRLGLVPLTEADLLPGPAAAPAARTEASGTLREALDAILASGLPAVDIVDDDRTLGHLDIAALQAQLAVRDPS